MYKKIDDIKIQLLTTHLDDVVDVEELEPFDLDSSELIGEISLLKDYYVFDMPIESTSIHPIRMLRSFNNVVFKNVRFTNVEFFHLDFGNCLFIDCSFKDCNFIGVDFFHCEMIRTSIFEVFMKHVDFFTTHFRDCKIVDVHTCNVEGENITTEDCEIVNSGFNLQCPDKGGFTAYKSLYDCKIAELYIPDDAVRSSGFTKKCRASKAKVIRIYHKDTGEEFTVGRSRFDPEFEYVVGMTVEPHEPFERNRYAECASGIHFFMTEEEAKAY